MRKLVITALTALALLAILPAGAAADTATCRQAFEARATGWQGVCQGLTCREAVEVADETTSSYELFAGACSGPAEAQAAEREFIAAQEAIAARGRAEQEQARQAACRKAIEGAPEPGACLLQSDVEMAEWEIAAAAKAKEEAARTKALSEPVTHLSVKAVAHPTVCKVSDCTYTLSYPGFTTLVITGAPFAYITVTLSRHGHRTERFQLGEESKLTMRVPWTCTGPGGSYRYMVSAHTDAGNTLVRKGAFRPVSLARCHRLKHEVQVAHENQRRTALEGQRQLEREERERLRRLEGNCRALGDTPAVLHIEGGIVHVCRTPGGYTVEVPE